MIRRHGLRTPAFLLLSALAFAAAVAVAAPSVAAEVYANTDEYSVPYRTSAIAVTPSGGTLYVASEASGRIYVYETATGDEQGTLNPRSFPHDLAMSADGSTLVAASAASARLTVFDAANPTGEVIDVPSLGTGDISVNADGSRIVVPRADGTGATVIERPSSLTPTALAVDGGTGMAFDLTGDVVFASDPSDGGPQLARVDLTSGDADARGGLGFDATGSVAVSPADGSVAVAGEDGIRVFSTVEDASPIFVATAQSVQRVAFSPDGSRILAIGHSEVTVVDAASLTVHAVARGAITVADAAMSPDNGELLVADGTRGTVLVFTSQRTALPPTNVAVTPGDGEVTVSWDAPSDMGSSGLSFYVVGYRTAGETWASGTSAMTTATTTTLTGLTNGEALEVRVSAYTGLGEGEWSSTAAVTPVGAPEPPRGVSASTSNGVITLQWEPPASDGGSPVTHYRVEEKTGDGAWTVISQRTASSTGISLLGRTPGVEYAYRVIALTEAGTSDPSEAATATLPVPVPPMLTASPRAGAALLTWTIDEDDSRPDFFAIEQRMDDGRWELIAQVLGTERELLVEGLTDGQEVEFRITAISGQTLGPTSAPVVVTVGAEAPAPPAEPSAEPTAPEPSSPASPTAAPSLPAGGEQPALAQTGPGALPAMAGAAAALLLLGAGLVGRRRVRPLSSARRPS